MHQLEPYWKWRDNYISEEDERSPFYGREYSEFEYSDTIYNYYIHPQWDKFGAETLVLKVLSTDYDSGFMIIEMMGEWNDILHNDIMHFKREVIDNFLHEGISRFVLIGENVLNFHPDEDSYYEEWGNEVLDANGWIAMVNFNEHVLQEMMATGINNHLTFQEDLNDLAWRKLQPELLVDLIETRLILSLNGE